MKASVAFVLLFGLSACAEHEMVESQRSTKMVSDLSDAEAYEVPAEDGVFVADAIRTDELAIISQEFVETYTSSLPAASSESARTEVAAKSTNSDKAPEPTKKPETPQKPRPQLPPEIQARIAACYPQWDKLPWAADTMINIRNFALDVQKLKKTNLQLTGTSPEIVFVSVESATRIAKVSLSMLNPKALYCVDIDAGKVINRLELISVCGARIGTVTIDSGRVTKNVSFKEVCP